MAGEKVIPKRIMRSSAKNVPQPQTKETKGKTKKPVKKVVKKPVEPEIEYNEASPEKTKLKEATKEAIAHEVYQILMDTRPVQFAEAMVKVKFAVDLRGRLYDHRRPVAVDELKEKRYVIMTIGMMTNNLGTTRQWLR